MPVTLLCRECCNDPPPPPPMPTLLCLPPMLLCLLDPDSGPGNPLGILMLLMLVIHAMKIKLQLLKILLPI